MRFQLLTTAAFVMVGILLVCHVKQSDGATSMINSEHPPLRIICLGDSITGRSDLRRYIKFSEILQEMLEAKRGLGSVEVMNRGIPGDTTAGVLKRLEADVLQEKPDIVVLLIAANDAIFQSSTPESTYQNLQKITDQLKAKSIRTLILQYHLAQNTGRPEVIARLEKFNQAFALSNELIGKVALAKDLPTLDMNQSFVNAAKAIPASELVNEADGVHLAPHGEIIYAREIFRKLDQLGWVQIP